MYRIVFRRTMQGAAARLGAAVAVFGLGLLAITPARSQTTLNYNTGIFRGATPPQGGYFFDLSDTARDFGQALAKYGIYFRATSVQDMQAVTAGGIKPNTRYANLTFFGFDFDLQRMLGFDGAKVHFWMTDQSGQTSTLATQSTGSLQASAPVFGDAFRLVNLSYEQDLLDNRLQFQVGRMNPVTDPGTVSSPPFDQTTWHCSFMTFICANPLLFAFNSPKPGYPSASWAGTVTVLPVKHVYFKVGVYENEPILNTSVNHNGWPGQDWGLNLSNGAFLPVQLGYLSTFADSAFPGSYFIGGYGSTATFSDRYYNTHHQPLAFAGGVPATDRGDSSFDLGADQVVYRQNMHDDRGLRIFGQANWDTSSLDVTAQQYAAGMIYKGLFDARPQDTIGFVTTLIELGSRYVAGRNALLAVHKIHGTIARNEIDFELSYGLAVAPGLTLRPFVQYINHPDQIEVPVPEPSRQFAVATGLLLNFNLDTFIGLPQLGPAAF